MTVNTELDTDDVDQDDAAPTPALNAAYVGVLSSYFEVNERINADTRTRRRLRKLVDAIPAGAYDDWQKVLGEAGEYPDMDKIAELLAKHGEDMPMKKGNAPLTVAPVAPVKSGKK